MSELAKCLRHMRTVRSLSQSELARVSGVSRASIAQIERGHCGASTLTAARLAYALNVSTGWLCGDAAITPDRMACTSVRSVCAHRSAGLVCLACEIARAA